MSEQLVTAVTTRLTGLNGMERTEAKICFLESSWLGLCSWGKWHKMRKKGHCSDSEWKHKPPPHLGMSWPSVSISAAHLYGGQLWSPVSPRVQLRQKGQESWWRVVEEQNCSWSVRWLHDTGQFHKAGNLWWDRGAEGFQERLTVEFLVQWYLQGSVIGAVMARWDEPQFAQYSLALVVPQFCGTLVSFFGMLLIVELAYDLLHLRSDGSGISNYTIGHQSLFSYTELLPS